MLRVCVWGLIVSLLMTSCSTPLQLNNQYQTKSVSVSPASYAPQPVVGSSYGLKSSTRQERVENVIKESIVTDIDAPDMNISALKLAVPTEVQLKYASLLDMVPTTLTNVKLLEAIDDWYGTRYRFGGTTKSGIDCSAFVREVYKVAFDIELPRTAREQFRAAQMAVSNLQIGDLLFFNTRGGVSHVGVYLGNNKFVHASTKKGVIVSGLDENYYSARYLGARRM